MTISLGSPPTCQYSCCGSKAVAVSSFGGISFPGAVLGRLCPSPSEPGASRSPLSALIRCERRWRSDSRALVTRAARFCCSSILTCATFALPISSAEPICVCSALKALRAAPSASAVNDMSVRTCPSSSTTCSTRRASSAGGHDSMSSAIPSAAASAASCLPAAAAAP